MRLLTELEAKEAAMNGATLAELYAELEGFNGARQRQPVGFATA